MPADKMLETTIPPGMGRRVQLGRDVPDVMTCGSCSGATFQIAILPVEKGRPNEGIKMLQCVACGTDLAVPVLHELLQKRW